jgi:GH15 family glucan-1,4-alpha-glucosidase
MSAAALVRIGNTGIALKLLDWLVQVVEHCESPERLRPLYTLSGNTLGPEAEISELSGYGHSRPVRIGNAASHQVQLDVFGPVVELVSLMADSGAPVTPEQWHLVEAMVKAVEVRWEEPDHGIWEIRGPKRHHVHSKTMCWYAVDRGLRVAAEAMGVDRPEWVRLRDRIAADVLERGFNAQAGFFTAAYGEPTADASSLLIGLVGLVAPSDPRFIATVDALGHELRDGPAVHRYLGDDGLPGREGAWVICACWLVEALALIGRTDEARTLFDQVASLAGPTGLMSEEWDARHGIPLGNFPQAYSHLGIINAAVRLSSLENPRAVVVT